MLNTLVACLAVLALLAGGAQVDAAKGSSHHSAGSTSGKSTTKTSSTSTKASSSHKAKAAVPRTNKGRIARSREAKHQFEVQSGFPHCRPGYVVDHVRPLVCGGADAPSNMQWQTIEAARAKDSVERRGC